MTLFKYGTDVLLRVIETLTIRFTPPSELNDPFELMPDFTVDHTREWIDHVQRDVVRQLKLQGAPEGEDVLRAQFMEGYPGRLAEQKRLALHIVRASMSGSRILCLSRLPPCDSNALLMWAHYTKGHSGMVLGFDDSHGWMNSEKSGNGQIRSRSDVVYALRRAGWTGTKPDENFFCRKSECWAYEREVRLTRFFTDEDFVPGPVQSLASFPAEMLLSVTLGVNSGNLDDAVVLVIGSNPKLRHVKVRKAEIHPDDYKLTMIDLPIRGAV